MTAVSPGGRALGACRERVAEFAELPADADSILIRSRLNEAVARIRKDLKRCDQEATGLEAMATHYRQVIETLQQEVLGQNRRHSEAAENLYVTQALLRRQGAELLRTLGAPGADALIAARRPDIDHSWRTGQMTSAMERLLTDAQQRLAEAARRLEALEVLARHAYGRFPDQFGFPPRTLPRCSLQAPQRLLAEAAGQAVRSFADPAHVVRDKRVVVDKFMQGPVERLRSIYAEAAAICEVWLKEALQPLLVQVQQLRSDIDARAADIERVRENVETLQARMAEIAERRRQVEEEQALLRALAAALV